MKLDYPYTLDQILDMQRQIETLASDMRSDLQLAVGQANSRAFSGAQDFVEAVIRDSEKLMQLVKMAKDMQESNERVFLAAR